MKNIKYPLNDDVEMKKVRDLSESLDLAVTGALFLSGINFVWGLFTIGYFVGIYGIVSATINIYTGFQLHRVRLLYESRQYKEALRILYPLLLPGYLCGFILFGLYLSRYKRNLEDILFKRYLINVEKVVSFYPPQIPKKRL